MGLYFAVDDSKFHDQDGQYWVIYVPQEKILVDGNPYKGYNKPAVEVVEGTIFINPSFYQMENDKQAWEKLEEPDSTVNSRCNLMRIV